MKDYSKLHENASEASEFLKAISHEIRLLAICNIGEGELSVHEMEERCCTSQSNLSQHLGKLRDRGVLVTRKEGNQVFYRLKDKKTLQLIKVLMDKFCTD